MAKQSESTVNTCQAHCVFGQQIDVPTEAPIAALAPELPLTIRLAVPHIPASAETFTLFASGAAPPPLLLFSRFLI